MWLRNGQYFANFAVVDDLGRKASRWVPLVGTTFTEAKADYDRLRVEREDGQSFYSCYAGLMVRLTWEGWSPAGLTLLARSVEMTLRIKFPRLPCGGWWLDCELRTPAGTPETCFRGLSSRRPLLAVC